MIYAIAHSIFWKMKSLPFFFFTLTICLFFACKQNRLDEQIAALEQACAAAPTPGKVDSLLKFYREAVDKHPDEHAKNFRYLSKGAELIFLKKDNGVTALVWADEALRKHAEGQALDAPIGLLARIWTARAYHKAPATRFKPDQIDQIQAYLQKNQVWLDSSLAQISRAMTDDKGVVSDKTQAEAFVEVAEGYADIVRAEKPDKYVALTLKAAGVAKSMGAPAKAVQLYAQVAEKMPEHPKAPTALFLTGFTYDNDLKDLEKAKKAYEDFLQRYPNDPDYADDARQSLRLLGKTPEQIIEEFQAQNAADPSR